jgi:hypothetical protein
MKLKGRQVLKVFFSRIENVQFFKNLMHLFGYLFNLAGYHAGVSGYFQYPISGRISGKKNPVSGRISDIKKGWIIRLLIRYIPNINLSILLPVLVLFI